MKPFDPGGAPHALAGDQPMAASSGESGSVQRCARREFFCPRGLKVGIFPEDAEKRVLHCTHGATLYFTGRTALFSASQGVLDKGQIFQAPGKAGGFISPRRKINSDGSPETMAGTAEGQEHTPADCSFKEIVGCSNAQQEDNNSSHVSASFDESVVLSNHLGASSLSSQNACHSTSSKFTSLQALRIPRAFALHISSDEMRQANGFCIEDPEAPSTPDLQPEVRSWDCEALPADNLCPTGANGLVLREKNCKKDADNILPAHKLLFKEEDIVSTCMVQCPAGKDYTSVSELLYKCSSSFLCENRKSANGKISSRKLNPRACRQYVAQRLSTCLMISRSPAACSNKLPEHKQAHAMVTKTGRLQILDTRIIVQEEMLAMLWVFSQRYLAPRSGSNFWLRCLDLEQDIVGSCKLDQCSSRSPSKVSIVSASDSPNLLEADNERLPRRTKSASELMPDFEEYLAESYGSSSWVQENGSIKVMEAMDERSDIPNEQVGQSLETCCSHLQAPPALNIKCSNGDIIDRGRRHFLASCTKDNRDEANFLPYAVDGPGSPTLSQCSLSSDLSMEGLKSSMVHGEVQERRSRAKLEQFAEIFLLRRHIKQQQQRAQQAPPYPCRESAGLVADTKSPRSVAVGKPSLRPCSFTDASIEGSVSMNHEPMTILTLPLTKPSDVSSQFCDNGICVGADVVIDIVGLVKYIEKHSSKLETFTDAAVHSISCTHMPFTGGQLVMPNVNAVIVTIVAIMVYTKIVLEGALSWVGSRTHSKDKT